MKKIIFMFITLISVCVLGLQAQSSNLGPDDSYRLYTGGASDVSSATDSVWNFSIVKAGLDSVALVTYLDVDTVLGHTPANVTVRLKGKTFPEKAYEVIDSVVWTSASDTVVELSSGYRQYLFYDYEIEGANNGVRFEVEKLNFLFNRK